MSQHFSKGNKAHCPVCKTVASKRELAADTKLRTIAGLYGQLEAATGRNMLMTQLPEPDLDVLMAMQQLQVRPRCRACLVTLTVLGWDLSPHSALGLCTALGC